MAPPRRRRKAEPATLFEAVVVATCLFFWVVLIWTVAIDHLPFGW